MAPRTPGTRMWVPARACKGPAPSLDCLPRNPVWEFLPPPDCVSCAAAFSHSCARSGSILYSAMGRRWRCCCCCCACCPASCCGWAGGACCSCEAAGPAVAAGGVAGAWPRDSARTPPAMLLLPWLPWLLGAAPAAQQSRCQHDWRAGRRRRGLVAKQFCCRRESSDWRRPSFSAQGAPSCTQQLLPMPSRPLSVGCI